MLIVNLAVGESKPWNILLFPLPLLPRHPGSPGVEEHVVIRDIRSERGGRCAGKDQLVESEIWGCYIPSVTHIINPVTVAQKTVSMFPDLNIIAFNLGNKIVNIM